MFEKILENKTFLKVIAIFLAVLLWLIVNPRADLSRNVLNVPVTWQNLPNDMMVTKPPENVNVVLQGDGRALDEIRTQDLVAYVDLEGKSPGTHTVSVKGSSPRGTRITSFSPQHVAIEIDEVISLQMPIEVEPSGNPRDGYQIEGTEVDTHQVFIQGPRKRIEEVAKILIVVDIDDAFRDIRLTAPLQVIDYNGRLITDLVLTPETVNVSVPIRQPEKELAVFVPVKGEPEEDFYIKNIIVSPSRLKIYGPMAILDETLQLETEAVDVSGASESITKNVNVVIQAGLSIEKTSVTVTIEIVEKD